MPSQASTHFYRGLDPSHRPTRGRVQDNDPEASGWPTDGVRHKHPIQEAEIAEQRLREEVGTKFDELLFLRYKATNDEPYPFEWASYADTFQDYSAALTRISRAYDTRFGP